MIIEFKNEDITAIGLVATLCKPRGLMTIAAGRTVLPIGTMAAV